MAAAKKWSVTYTKHVKQKRKVYQDGFLTFDSSSNKVMLYDSSEKLLECRLVKSDEVVRSGEMLMFNAYLVDVGDLEGGEGPLSAVSSCSCATNVDENENCKAEKSRAGTTTISPSRNIMRGRHFEELKRREINKYGMLSKSPDSVTTIADWHVLYTTQLTQKAKKYHDGFLRFTNVGSMNSQVQLYDENWNLLDSRFMKKAEEVKPGEKMIFHAHVVEVVKPRGNQETTRSLYPARNRDQSFQQLHDKKVLNDLNSHKPVDREEKSKKNVFSSPECNFSNGEPIRAEWQVLYTAQVMKKAKMYQDGILQLTTRGSLGRQITLYDESRRVLNNRFLRKDELIQSDQSIAFDGHLVDIGAPKGQGEIPVDLDNEEVIHISDKTKKHVNFNRPDIRQSIQKGQLAGRNLKRASSVDDCSSNAGISNVKEPEQTERSSMQKRLRDANQILSILRNPCSEEKDISSSDASKGVSAFIVKKPHSLENAMSDYLDNGSIPASNGASFVEIVDFQTSGLTVGCAEDQSAQTLQVQDLEKPCYDNESNAQGSQSASGASTSSYPLRHQDEMSTFGPIKTDHGVYKEFPTFDLGF